MKSLYEFLKPLLNVFNNFHEVSFLLSKLKRKIDSSHISIF